MIRPANLENSQETIDVETPPELRALLLNYDERRGEQGSIVADSESELSGELQERLAADRQCLDLLHRAWPAASHPDPVADFDPPHALGDFRIIREVGRGGMGVVYEAEQLSLGRRVALKVLPFTAMLDEKAITRFKNEARAAATLEHPHIVPVFAVGNERGVYYYAMAYIEGRTLAEMVAALRKKSGQRNVSPANSDETLDFKAHQPSAAAADTQPELEAALSTLPDYGSRAYHLSVVRLGIQAARALHHAHERGIVHRDIKPGNLMVDTAGKVWITDFGLARIESEAGMTMTGDLLGTLRYMAPEQADGRTSVVDQRTDIFALGLTLYELLTLRPAFDAKDRGQLLKQIEEKDPPQLRRVNSSLPADLETIVGKAIVKEPKDRYATAAELADDLERLLELRPIKAKPPGLISRIVKWSRRHVAAVWVLLLVLLAFTGFSLASTVIVKKAYEKENQQRQLATLEKQKAERNEDRALRRLYVAHIGMAAEALKSKSYDQVTGLLDKYLSVDGKPYERGFEWRYLWDQVRHTGVSFPSFCYQIAYSPDGKLLAAPDVENACIRLHDALTGKLHKVLKGCTCRPTDLQFSPDGKRLVAVGGITGEPGCIWSWNVQSGKLRKIVQTGPDSLWTMDYSSDGRFLIVGTRGDWDAKPGPGEIALYDADTLEKLRVFYTSESAKVHSVTFLPNGERLAALITDSKKRVLFWEVESGSALGEFSPAFGNQIAASSNGLLLACGGSSQVGIWDTTTFKHVRDMVPSEYAGAVFDVAFSPDGATVAASYKDGAVRIWEVANGELASTLTGHSHWVFSVAFSPDGRTLASSDKNREVQVRSLATPPSESITIEAHDPKRGNNGIKRHLIDVSLDGEILVAIEPGGKLVIWDNLTTRRLHTLNFPGTRVLAVALSPDKSIVAASLRSKDGGGSIELWDAITGRQRRVLANKEGYQQLAFSSDGSQLFATVRGEVLNWNLNVSRQRPIRLEVHDRSIASFAISPDGSKLATCCRESRNEQGSVLKYGKVKLWDLNTGKLVREYEATLRFCSVAFSPDSKLLAIAGGDWFRPFSKRGFVQIWNTQENSRVASLTGHNHTATDVAFSRDGLTLASCSWDGDVKLWDTREWQQYYTVDRFSGGVDSIHFADDGNLLVATEATGAVHQWRVTDDHQSGFYTEAIRSGRHFISLGQWEKAIAAFQPATTGGLEKWYAWNCIGHAHAEMGRWSNAVTAYSKVLETDVVGRSRYEQWLRLSISQLAAEDTGGYRRTCKAMLDELGQQPSLDHLREAAWVSLVGRSSGGDYSAIQKLLKTIHVEPPVYVDELLLGVTAFRMGNYKAALELLSVDKAGSYDDFSRRRVKYIPPAAHLYLLAMTHQHLGNRDTAQKYYSRANTKALAKYKVDMKHHGDGEPWYLRVIVSTLRQEAEDLMGESLSD